MKWITDKSKTPEPMLDVLVVAFETDVDIAHYVVPSDKRKKPYWEDRDGNLISVTAWMKKPNLPKLIK